jgi:hypothetical protein
VSGLPTFSTLHREQGGGARFRARLNNGIEGPQNPRVDAREEFPLAATAQNMRKLAKLIRRQRQQGPESPRLNPATTKNIFKTDFFNEICQLMTLSFPL